MARFSIIALLLFSLLCAAPGVLPQELPHAAEPSHHVSDVPDLTGEWEIQEEDKSYTANLDKDGNGPYSWQGGHITTLGMADRKWNGTWQQPGNDREGGFDLLLSADGTEAKGVWWYTRVGDRKNIPPRQWGGSYVWKRLSTSPSTPVSPP